MIASTIHFTGLSCISLFRLKKEMIVRVNTVASEFRKVSNKQMAETTKRTLRENVAINAQLSKMSDKTMELIQDNDELKEKETSARLQTEMLEHNETELIKKNASNLRVNFVHDHFQQLVTSFHHFIIFSVILNFKIVLMKLMIFIHFK